MSLSLALVLNDRSRPNPLLSAHRPTAPIGVVEVDGLTIQANDPADLTRLAEALIVASELLSSASVAAAEVSA